MSSANVPIEISCHDVAGLRSSGEQFVFIDCREPDEAAVCQIEGAQLLPMSVIADRIGELAGHEVDRVVVYCHKGGRSYRVANWLRQQGYSQVQSMAGGIDQWAVEIEPGMARY